VLPDVPTIAEAGFPGGEFDFWVGMLAPGKTPRDVLAKINAEVNRALASPDMKDRLTKLGGEPMNMSPGEFDAFMRKEHDVLGQLMRDAGATRAMMFLANARVFDGSAGAVPRRSAGARQPHCGGR